jgi:hypothetical protein
VLFIYLFIFRPRYLKEVGLMDVTAIHGKQRFRANHLWYFIFNFFDRLSWKELLVAPTPPLKITNPDNYEVSYGLFFGPIQVYK